MVTRLEGTAPGAAAGTMSQRTARLRPEIGLLPTQIVVARRMRREGLPPDEIARQMGVEQDQVERALLQMRSRRPESTRGTLNVTLEAHRLVLAERDGDEPLWVTVDRMLGELLAFRAPGRAKAAVARRTETPEASQPKLDL